MENQNLIMKTGFVPKRKRGVFLFIVLVLIFSLMFQPCAFALGRSNAGGGKLASFSVGKWAAGTAIGLASFTLGSALASSMTGGTGFSTLGSMTTWTNNYSVMIAVEQSGRAMSLAGQYYGWDPKATIFASSIVSSMVGGGLNPGQFGVTGAFNGMAMGGIYGSIDGAALAGLADDKGQVPAWAGPVAGLAAGFGTGFVSGGFTNSSDQFSFGNDFDSNNGFGVGVFNTVSGLPGAGISAGLGYASQGKDRQDSYIINQAGSGLYPVAGAYGSQVGSGVVTGLGYTHLNVVPVQNNYNTTDSRMHVSNGVLSVSNSSASSNISAYSNTGLNNGINTVGPTYNPSIYAPQPVMPGATSPVINNP